MQTSGEALAMSFHDWHKTTPLWDEPYSTSERALAMLFHFTNLKTCLCRQVFRLVRILNQPTISRTLWPWSHE